MSNLQSAVVKFDEALQKISGRSRANQAYQTIRNDAAKVLEQFKKDPPNTDLVETCTHLVRRIENLNAEKLSSTKFLRSKEQYCLHLGIGKTNTLRRVYGWSVERGFVNLQTFQGMDAQFGG